MPYDSLVRRKQVNQPEFSGFIVDVLLQYLKTGAVTGIATNTGELTGQFYPLKQNVSGYLTTGSLTGLATTQDVSSTATSILAYSTQNFYSQDNPSGYVTSGGVSDWMKKTGASYLSSETLGFSLFDAANGFKFFEYVPDDIFVLRSWKSPVSLIDFNPSSQPQAYISGFDIWTNKINGFPAMSSQEMSGRFITWDYFDTGYSLSVPHLFLENTITGGYLLFNKDAFYGYGVRANYPSENIILDFYGNQAPYYGINSNRPFILGFDIYAKNLQSSGYNLITVNDLSGLAIKQELLTASGELADDIWILRTDVTNMITGGAATQLQVTGHTITGTTILTGAGNTRVYLQDGHTIVVSGQSFTGSYVSGIIVTGRGLAGGITFSGSTGIRVLADTLTNTVHISTQNVVLTTGNQTISGYKTFARAVNTLNGLSVNYNGLLMGDLHLGYLYDNTENLSLVWQNRYLYQDNITIALDWKKLRLSGDWTAQSLFLSGRSVVVTDTTDEISSKLSTAVFNTGDQNISGLKDFKYAYTNFQGVNTLGIQVSSNNANFQGAYFNQTINAAGGIDSYNTPIQRVSTLTDSGSGVSVDVTNRILSGNWDIQSLTISGAPITNLFGGVSAIAVTGLSLSGVVSISGIGGTIVTISGNTVLISGGSSIDTGNFEPILLGLPTDGVYGGPNGAVAGVQQGDTHPDAFDKIEVVLGKLAPSKPLNLSQATFNLSGTSYSAFMQGTTTQYTSVFNSLRFTGFATGFYDGDAGILSGFINGNATGAKAITTGIDTGNFSGLKIYGDYDFWSGVAGKAGFWSALNAQVSPTSDMPTGLFTVQMRHSTAGNTPVRTGYAARVNTTANSIVSSGTGACTLRRIDGVVSFAANDPIYTVFTVTGAVTSFYANPMARLTCSQMSTVNVASTGSPVSGNQLWLSGTQLVSNSSYVTGAVVTVTSYNFISGSTANGYNTQFRIDTSSNQQAQRKTAGSGRWPSVGYGTGYDNNVSLAGNEELQMINGTIQYPPRINYGNFIPSGLNYTNLPSGTFSGYRWAYFDFGSISSVSNIQVTFNSTSNFGASAINAGMLLYAKVSGATAGWIDGNAAYPGVGNPTNDGDPALVVGSSSATVKLITFGTAALSGPVYIRVGLPSGSTKSFGTVSFATA